jgi:hypothetical protein
MLFKVVSTQLQGIPALTKWLVLENVSVLWNSVHFRVVTRDAFRQSAPGQQML